MKAGRKAGATPPVAHDPHPDNHQYAPEAGHATPPPRVSATHVFDVWHNGQMVHVLPGRVRDPALIATLRAMPDQSMLEWSY